MLYDRMRPDPAGAHPFPQPALDLWLRGHDPGDASGKVATSPGMASRDSLGSGD